MMDKIGVLLAGGLALIAVTPARAQAWHEDDDYDLPDTPADVFSGPHVELSAGFDHLGVKSYKDIDAASDISSTKSSASYGGAFGYDLPLTENMTLGAEFGLYTSSTKWTNPGLVAGTFNLAQVRAGRDLFAGVRLGYAFSLRTQVFAKAGYTNTHFGIYATDGSEVLYEGIAANGARAGLGIEHHLTRTLYVKLEADYSQYGTGGFNFNGTSPDGSNFVMHNARQQVLGSVGFRF